METLDEDTDQILSEFSGGFDDASVYSTVSPPLYYLTSVTFHYEENINHLSIINILIIHLC